MRQYEINTRLQTLLLKCLAVDEWHRKELSLGAGRKKALERAPGGGRCGLTLGLKAGAGARRAKV